jgi:tight adherence protein B
VRGLRTRRRLRSLRPADRGRLRSLGPADRGRLRSLGPADRGRLRSLGPADRGRHSAAVRRSAAVLRRPRLLAVAAGACAGVPAALVAGLLAGLVVGVYGVVATGCWLRRRQGRDAVRVRAQALDALAALAADLRAGLPPSAAREAAPLIDAVPLIRDRVATAIRVADRTGAPLADLLDRLEVDLRGLDRVRLTAAAHAAGTRATAGLLAVLPLAGIGVGYGMGADPLHVLLHTPVGAGCVLAALLLQLAGLGWTARLTRLDGS